MTFADRLVDAVLLRESQIVLGLDPDPARLLPGARAAAGSGTPAERAARAVAAHCRELIGTAGAACVAVKLQMACFERLGAPGWEALARSADAAREAGLLVIADGKRGDVPHTAAVYAQALVGVTATPWGEVRGLGADAITANPFLGRDSLEPLVTAARAARAGTFVLVRTSNPGAGEIQDQPAVAQGGPLRRRLAALVDSMGAGGIGECGLSDVGAVVAATEPALLAELRADMPQAIFLLPGVGAQGGRVDLLAAAFAPGRAAALVAASRSISNAALDSGDGSAALRAAEELRETAWNLSAAAA
jgi:orotidine-5'-phosphate decarboxylase